MDYSEKSPRHRIERAFETRLLGQFAFRNPKKADLVLDAGDSGAWTVRIRSGRIHAERGRSKKPTSTVITDGRTLAEVLEGKRSGVDTWLKGFLRVRGSIALALQLEGMLHRPSRPAHFPVPKVIDAGKIATFYIEAGEGEPVILLHGLGATGASMLTTMLALAPNYRVIVPDLPGFGESAKPITRYSAKFFSNWLVKLMDTLNIRRSHLIGNSMGGRISIETALLYPERVNKLALFAPAVAFRRLRQAVPIVRMLRPELGAVPVPVPRNVATAFVRQIFSKPDRLPDSWYDAAIDEFFRVFSTRRGRIALFSAARQIYLDHPWGATGFWERLRELEAPALFIWGGRDILIPHKFDRHVSDALPNCYSVVFPDCGHVPQFELPEKTHAYVKRFFAGEPPPEDEAPPSMR